MLPEIDPCQRRRRLAADEQFVFLDLDGQVRAPGHEDHVETRWHVGADEVRAVLARTPAKVVECIEAGAQQFFARNAGKAGGALRIGWKTHRHRDYPAYAVLAAATPAPGVTLWPTDCRHCSRAPRASSTTL